MNFIVFIGVSILALLSSIVHLVYLVFLINQLKIIASSEDRKSPLYHTLEYTLKEPNYFRIMGLVFSREDFCHGKIKRLKTVNRISFFCMILLWPLTFIVNLALR